jgi:hypothetical protein
MALVLSKRVGRAVNVAPILGGVGTGTDGALFDGVLAVIEA